PLLVVADVQSALEALGRAGRARTGARVVAVTGSAGKTSTKEMLRHVLSAQGRTHAAEASYNNHWGVPLTLARMPADADFAVIEIGMNRPGEIAPLARMARPDVAIVTTVAPAHLEAFDDIGGIAREKASIFEGLGPGGSAVFNADLDQTPILARAATATGAQAVRFGRSANRYRLVSAQLAGEKTVVEAALHGDRVLFKLGTPGRHFAMNGLAVLAAVEALGADAGLAALALGQWRPRDGRGTRALIRLDPADPRMTLMLYDDSYNANPASIGAALDVLAAAEVRHDIGRVSKGRRIAYLGDMKELGPTGPEMHRALAGHPAVAAVDQIHAIGPLMRELWQVLPEQKRGRWCETADEMAGHVHDDLDAGDVVLAKGSLGMGLARVVSAIRAMDDETRGRKGRG
ncbi:MAG: Mur ligase family protein, partial [Roseovarius sp.]|nr:Mur ligase family protein [Roseovarius sp.]